MYECRILFVQAKACTRNCDRKAKHISYITFARIGALVMHVNATNNNINITCNARGLAAQQQNNTNFFCAVLFNSTRFAVLLFYAGNLLYFSLGTFFGTITSARTKRYPKKMCQTLPAMPRVAVEKCGTRGWILGADSAGGVVAKLFLYTALCNCSNFRLLLCR